MFRLCGAYFRGTGGSGEPHSPLNLPLELQAFIRCARRVYAALRLEGDKRADSCYLVEGHLVL
jgi:hypothetical protein